MKTSIVRSIRSTVINKCDRSKCFPVNVVRMDNVSQEVAYRIWSSFKGDTNVEMKGYTAELRTIRSLDERLELDIFHCSVTRGYSVELTKFID